MIRPLGGRAVGAVSYLTYVGPAVQSGTGDEWTLCQEDKKHRYVLVGEATECHLRDMWRQVAVVAVQGAGARLSLSSEGALRVRRGRRRRRRRRRLDWGTIRLLRLLLLSPSVPIRASLLAICMLMLSGVSSQQRFVPILASRRLT